MRRPVVLTAAVIVVGTMCLGTGCSMLSADEEALAPPPTASVTTDPGIGLTVVDEANRGAPLEISGIDLDGKPLALADSRGDITVVNGWASWCSPCRAEMPEFAEAARTFEGQGVTFVGINVEDNEDDARAFTVDTPYRSIVDKDGTLLAQIPDIPPRSLPVTVILDRDGRVAVQIVGPIVLGTLEDTIASVIASEA
ncbi:MAG: TlpA family protein disulfide reductase [Candidatus Nanopelagicales bacterium]